MSLRPARAARRRLRALLRGLGSFAGVTGHVKLDTSGSDVASLFLPVLRWETVASDPYMLCVLDVVSALQTRRYPPGLSLDLTFSVVAHFRTEVNGGYRLRVSGGRADCEPVDLGGADPSGPVFTGRGLALLYAGVQSAANLRFAGLLTAGEPADDSALDAPSAAVSSTSGRLLTVP